MKSTTNFSKQLVLAVCVWALASPTARAQFGGQATDAELQLKVYPVHDLVISPPDYPFQGWDQLSASTLLSGAVASGGGGFGGGGGGVFVTGGGGGAGSAAGRPGGLSSSPVWIGIDDLKATILATVAPTSWNQDGEGAVCTVLGGTLVIKQTARAHEQIDALLESIRVTSTVNQTVSIEALWLSLNPTLLREATESAPNTVLRSMGLDREILLSLEDQVPSYRAQVTCFNGQTVHVTTGEQRTVAVNAVPVVGAGAVGYQLTIARPNLGAVIQVLPIISADRKEAILDVHSVLTGWNEPGEPLQVNSYFGPARGNSGVGPGATDLGSGSVERSAVEIDRLHLSAQELATTVRIPFGTPVLVGGMSSSGTRDATPATDAQQPWQWYLFVEMTLNE